MKTKIKSSLKFQDVVKEFDKKIETTIRGYNLKSTDAEDVKNSIYLKWLETDFLSKYDKKYAVSTYIYGYVKNYCLNIWKRENRTRAGRAFKNAISIFESATSDSTTDSDDSSFKNVLFLDLFKDSAVEYEFSRQEFIMSLLKELDKGEFNKFNSTSPSGLPRSVKEIVNLFLNGHTLHEIADTMDMSYSWVMSKIHELKEVKWLQEYKMGV